MNKSEPLNARELDTSEPMPLYMQISSAQAPCLFPFGEIFPQEKGEAMSKSNSVSCEGSESGAKAEEGE